MIKRMTLFVLLALSVAACGTTAEPQFNVAQTTEEPAEIAETEEAVATEEPTDEPTATPTLEPTEVVTEEPTPEPTEEPTEEPAVSDDPDAAAADDPLALFIGLANAENGETLFRQSFDTPSGSWMCSTCHSVDTPDTLVGPTLLNIGETAISRVEGEGPYTYIYNSIKNSQAFIVEGFAAGLMPDYSEVLTDAQIYDLVAYLMTLEN